MLLAWHQCAMHAGGAVQLLRRGDHRPGRRWCYACGALLWPMQGCVSWGMAKVRVTDVCCCSSKRVAEVSCAAAVGPAHAGGASQGLL